MDLSDPQTFGRAYRDHSAGVHGTALRILGDAVQAQDVTQDVFLRLWRDPSRFDARRGELGPYLRLMARSRALDVWRERQAASRARDRLELVAARDERARADDGPAASAERAERRDEVRAALRGLPAPQREALLLAYWGERTSAEIAGHADVPLGTAKSRIRLGVARLQEVLVPAA